MCGFLLTVTWDLGFKMDQSCFSAQFEWNAKHRRMSLVSKRVTVIYFLMLLSQYQLVQRMTQFKYSYSIGFSPFSTLFRVILLFYSGMILILMSEPWDIFGLFVQGELVISTRVLRWQTRLLLCGVFLSFSRLSNEIPKSPYLSKVWDHCMHSRAFLWSSHYHLYLQDTGI